RGAVSTIRGNEQARHPVRYDIRGQATGTRVIHRGSGGPLIGERNRAVGGRAGDAHHLRAEHAGRDERSAAATATAAAAATATATPPPTGAHAAPATHTATAPPPPGPTASATSPSRSTTAPPAS